MSTEYNESRKHVGAPDGSGTELPSKQARQGVISGRVVAVLAYSTLALALIYAIIWLGAAH